MDEVLEAALAEGVSVRAFFLTHAARIHAARRDDFVRVAAVPFLISLYLQDTDERYTVEIREDGIEVEDDELIDFPTVTIFGHASEWARVKEQAREVIDALEARRPELEARYGRKQSWTARVRDEFERFDGAIEVTITETGGPDVTFKLVLNDYNPGRGKVMTASLPLSLIRATARGEQTPEQAARQVRLGGHRMLGTLLAGFWSKHLG